MNLGRLYNIQNDGYHYHVGYRDNGNLVLMGIQQPEVVLVEFDAGGNYLGVNSRVIALKPSKPDDYMVRSGTEELEEGLRNWQQEIRFAAATIAIKQFFLSERWIGVEDLPRHYQESIDHSDLDDETRENIRLWKEQGSFVLYWDEEYWLSEDGELESS